MAVTDLGLTDNSRAYRTRVECDGEGCGVANLIDTDKIFSDEAPGGFDVREQQLLAFVKASGGVLICSADGVMHFYCTDHKPVGE